MKKGTINCPECGAEFELSEALTGQIRDDLKNELSKDVLEREKRLKKKESELKSLEESVSKSRESIDEEVQKQLQQKLAEAEKKASKKLEDQYSSQLKELKEELDEKSASIETFRKQELELRKKQRELTEASESFKLEMTRKLDAEREKIREEVAKKAAEDHHLKDLEKDKRIADLNKALDDMKRKVEQGSSETQGEVLEQDLELQLKGIFLHDDISPIPKGIRGADLIQKVNTPLGIESGTLLWEMKNTKDWGSKWIQKLKDDMIDTRADLAILVTVALPEGVTRFGRVEGVWVCDPLSAIPLGAVLREQLIAINGERRASMGKNEKMEYLYRYLSGTEFKQKIEGIVDAFTLMQDQLNQERRVFEKQWKQREMQIKRVIKNTVGLYGDMQGIIGHLPTIPALELDDVALKQLSDGQVSEEEIENDN